VVDSRDKGAARVGHAVAARWVRNPHQGRECRAV
jgi:hypothetical protein